jgi:hypothetical protein
MGEWDECLRESEDLIAEDARRGGSQVGTFAKAWAALVRFFRGETAEPLAMMEESLESARDIEDPQALLPCLAIVVGCSAMAGDDSRGLSLVSEFVQMAPDHPTFLSGSLVYIAPVMQRHGMVAELNAVIAAARTLGPGPNAELDAARGALAELQGNLPEAYNRLTSAIATFDEIENLFNATNARIDAARIAGLQGKDDERFTLLETAKRDAEKMGARRLLDQIASLSADQKAAAGGR